MGSGTKESALINKIRDQKAKKIKPRQTRAVPTTRCALGVVNRYILQKTKPVYPKIKPVHPAEKWDIMPNCANLKRKKDFRSIYATDKQENYETDNDRYVFCLNENDKAEKKPVIFGGVKVGS